jgi:hypothetical protein
MLCAPLARRALSCRQTPDLPDIDYDSRLLPIRRRHAAAATTYFACDAMLADARRRRFFAMPPPPLMLAVRAAVTIYFADTPADYAIMPISMPLRDTTAPVRHAILRHAAAVIIDAVYFRRDSLSSGAMPPLMPHARRLPLFAPHAAARYYYMARDAAATPLFRCRAARCRLAAICARMIAWRQVFCRAHRRRVRQRIAAAAF